MTRYYGTAQRWEPVVLGFLLASAGMLAVLSVDQFVPPLGTHQGLGHYYRIPQDDMPTDFRVGFLWGVVLWLSLLVWPVRNADKRALLHIWLVKMVVVLGAIVVMESLYDGQDAFYYFGQPQREGFRWPGFTFGDGTSNIISLSWLHQQVMPARYHAMRVSFAMVGLIAIYVYYRAAVRFLGREDIRVLYLLALFPGILFWSSILGKDPVMLLGISLYAYGVVGIHTHRRAGLKRLAYAIPLAAGIALASLIRVWLGPILIAPLAVFVLFGVRNILVRVLMVMVVAGAFARVISLTNETFNVETREDLVERTDDVSHRWSDGAESAGGSSLSVTRFQDLGTMVKFAPFGAFTALFRPLPGEVLNSFGLLAGLESLVLLALLLRATKRTRWRELKQPLILWASTLILIWAVVYGFASIQNLGTAVRWKLQVLPLLVGLLCYLGRRRPEMLRRCP